MSPAALPPEGRVCAVVVTFNRKVLLRGLLDSVLIQTRRPDHIVVIDNHSTDGTLDLLRAEYENRSDTPPLTVVPLSENSGGSGGFSAGIDWAHKHGFDWLWVMDDDVVMAPHTLETLLSYRGLSNFVQCVREMSDAPLFTDCLWDVSSANLMMPQERMMKDDGRAWIPVHWGCFEGALIHRTVVDQIGLPDSRFFITLDDSIYGFEASFHTNVIYLREMLVQKKIGAPPRPGRLLHYVTLRNRFLVRERFKKYGLSVHPAIFWMSQLATLGWAVKGILRDSGETKKLQMITTVIRGLWDGARGRFGRPWFLKA